MMDIVYTVLGLGTASMPYVLAPLFALAVALFALLLYRNPVAGAVAVLGLFAVETLFVFLFAFSVGLSIYPQDLLFAPMALIAAVRLCQRGALRRLPRPLWLLAGAMVVSFSTGLVLHGTTAGVEFRADFYYLTCIFYFSCFQWSREQVARVMHWFMVIAVFVLLIVWYRWVADSIGLDWVDPVWRLADATGVPLRVINAGQAMLLGSAVIVLMYAISARSTLSGWLLLLPPLALTVLVLQHRSVWVAAFLPALSAFIVVKRNQAQLIARLFAMLALTLVVLVPLMATGQFDSTTASVTDLANKATSTTGGTFVGRVEGWDALLHQWAGAGPKAWIIGSPYGSGFVREAGPAGQEIAYAPHNYYVQLLLRVGIVGLLAFLHLQVRLFAGAARLGAGPTPELSGYTMIGLLLSAALYNIPYAPSYVHGLLVGLVLAQVLQHAPAPLATSGRPAQTRPGTMAWRSAPKVPS